MSYIVLVFTLTKKSFAVLNTYECFHDSLCIEHIQTRTSLKFFGAIDSEKNRYNFILIWVV